MSRTGVARGLFGRVLLTAAVLPALSILLFAALEAVPREPVGLSEGNEAAALREAERARLEGRDRPLLVRYRCWLMGRSSEGCGWWPHGQGILRGDLGVSTVHRRPVRALLATRVGRTLRIMGPGLGIGLFSALVFGAAAGARPGGRLDRAVSTVGFVGLAAPLHWLAMMGVWGLGVELGWFPVSGVDDPLAPGGWSTVRHAALPALVLGTFFFGRWFRFVRAEVADRLGSPWVRGMRARGLPERRILRHVALSGLPTVLTVVGHALPALLSGSVVVERVFVYPGMGLLFLDSVLAQDLPVAGIILLAYAAVSLLAAVVTDAAVWALGPRRRSGGLG